MAPRLTKRKQLHESQESFAASPRTRKKSRVVLSRSNSPSTTTTTNQPQPAQPQPTQQDSVSEEPWYAAIEILEENRTEFLIRWEGTDPATRLPYEPTWEPKRYANKELRTEWTKKKRERALTDTPNGTPKKRRIHRPTGLNREESVSSSLATDSVADTASAKKRTVDGSLLRRDTLAGANESPPAQCPETPQSSDCEHEDSSRLSINIEAGTSLPSSAQHPLSSPRLVPNGRTEVLITQKPDFNPDSFAAASPAFSSQVVKEVEVTEDSAFVSPSIERKERQPSTHRGAGIVPDSQSLPGSSSYIPSTASKRTSGTGTFIPTQDLGSTALEESPVKNTLELTAAAPSELDTGFSLQAIESDPIEDPATAEPQTSVEHAEHLSSPQPLYQRSSPQESVQPNGAALAPQSDTSATLQPAQETQLTDLPSSEEQCSIDESKAIRAEFTEAPTSKPSPLNPVESSPEQRLPSSPVEARQESSPGLSQANISRESPIPPAPFETSVHGPGLGQDPQQETQKSTDSGSSLNGAPAPVLPPPSQRLDRAISIDTTLLGKDKYPLSSASDYTPAVESALRSAADSTDISILGRSPSPPHKAYSQGLDRLSGLETAHLRLKRVTQEPSPEPKRLPTLGNTHSVTPSPIGARILRSIEGSNKSVSASPRKFSSPIPSIPSLPSQAFLKNPLNTEPAVYPELHQRSIFIQAMQGQQKEQSPRKSPSASVHLPQNQDSLRPSLDVFQQDVLVERTMSANVEDDEVGRQEMVFSSRVPAPVYGPISTEMSPPDLHTANQVDIDSDESEESEEMEIDELDPELENTGIPLGTNEYVIPITFENIPRSSYRGFLKGAASAITEISTDPESADIAALERLVWRLQCLESHMDLLVEETTTPSQNARPRDVVNWYSNQHQNFKILRHVFDRLQQSDAADGIHIVLAAAAGKMMDLVEIFLRGVQVNYSRTDRPENQVDPDADGLFVTIIPTSGAGSDARLLKPATVVFLFDFDASASTPAIRSVRSTPSATPCPLISFAVINSVSHVKRCLVAKGFNANPSPSTWLRPLVCLTAGVRMEVGSLNAFIRDGYEDWETSVKAVADFIQSQAVEGGDGNAMPWVLKPLQPLGSLEEMIQEYGLSSDESGSVSASNEGEIEVEATDKVKTSEKEAVRSPGITQAQNLKRPAEMERTESNKRFRPSPQPKPEVHTMEDVETQQPAQHPVQHSTQTQESTHPEAEASGLSVVGKDEELDTKDVDSLVDASNEPAIQDTATMNEQLLQPKEEMLLKDYVTALEKVQNENYGLRAALRESSKARNAAESLAEDRGERLEQRDATITSLRAENKSLKTQLEELRAIATKQEVPDLANFAKLKIENEELKDKAAKAMSAKQFADGNFEFVRSQYQTAQTMATEHRSRVDELEAEVARLTPLADGSKLKLHSLARTNATQLLSADNEGLRARIAQYEKLLKRKEDEIKVLKETPQRMMTTRGSSVPLQRSPRTAPLNRFGSGQGSRAGSPAKVPRVGALRGQE